LIPMGACEIAQLNLITQSTYHRRLSVLPASLAMYRFALCRTSFYTALLNEVTSTWLAEIASICT